MTIQSFRNAGLQLFWETGNTRRLANQQAARIRRMLQALDAATAPRDMDLPGYMFHGLGLMGPGRYSVRVTGNWRLTFAFDDGHAVSVDLEDYH